MSIAFFGHPDCHVHGHIMSCLKGGFHFGLLDRSGWAPAVVGDSDHLKLPEPHA